MHALIICSLDGDLIELDLILGNFLVIHFIYSSFLLLPILLMICEASGC